MEGWRLNVREISPAAARQQWRRPGAYEWKIDSEKLGPKNGRDKNKNNHDLEADFNFDCEQNSPLSVWTSSFSSRIFSTMIKSRMVKWRGGE